MTSNLLYIARMDVEHDKEALFNEVYDSEHVPEMSKVSGVLKISRYWTPSLVDPKYMIIYEIESPDLLQTPKWKEASEIGRWASEVYPHTMNLYHAVYSWVGGAPELTYRTKYLWFAMMDVEQHKDALFNELYDSEHIPQIVKRVPGVVNCVRYTTMAEAHSRYLAIWEIEQLDVPASAAFWKAADTGRWKSEVRPWTYNRRRPIYERIEV